VLGRDIVGYLAVIMDRPDNTVCLFHQRYRYRFVGD
jgi:hypothetical protein